MYLSLLNPNHCVNCVDITLPFYRAIVQSVCLTVWTTGLALYSYSFDRLRCEPRKFLIQMSGAILNGEPRHVHWAERASAILLDYSRTVCSGAATQPQTCASKHEYDTSLNAQLYTRHRSSWQHSPCKEQANCDHTCPAARKFA